MRALRRIGGDYLRLSGALVLGLYLPFAAGAADQLRFWSEAGHLWLAVFVGPYCLLLLLGRGLARCLQRAGARPARLSRVKPLAAARHH